MSITTIILIAMENQSYIDVLGNGTGNSQAPFLKSLLPQGSTIPRYNDNIYYPGSSEGSYVAMVGGNTYGAGNGTRNIGNSSTLTIVNGLEAAGVNWHVIQNGSRGGDHNGFLDYTSITGNSSRASHCVNGTETDLVNYVNGLNVNALNFVWFTPSDSDNMHDNSVSSGDNYLSGFVPQILASPVFKTGKALVILWWDEWSGGGTLQVPIIFLGPVKKGYISPNLYQHYDVLRTIESIFNIQPMSNGPDFPPGDMGGRIMTEILSTGPPPPPTALTTSFTSTSNPVVNTPVIFTSVTSGGTPPYTIGWDFGDNTTGIGAVVSHTYNTVGTYNVVNTATDTASTTATHTAPIIITALLPPPPPPPTGTGNFTSDWTTNNVGGSPTVGSINIVNGVLQTRESTPGGNDNAYGYATTQRGTFPWSPVNVAGTALPTGITNIQTRATLLRNDILSGHSRYHIYIGLYYQLQSAVTSGGTTKDWFDTQVRIEKIDGVDSSTGKTETYLPGDSFGWDIVAGQLNPGQSLDFDIDVEKQFQSAAAAYGVSTTTPHQLMGIEIGTEGFLIQELDVDWPTVNLTTTASPPTVTYRLEAPPGTIIISNATISACQAAISTLPPSTAWQILDSNNVLISSGTTPSTSPVTYRLEAPPGTIIIDNTTLLACQTAVLSLPFNTAWQIFDSNNTLINSGTTPPAPPPPTPTGTVLQFEGFDLDGQNEITLRLNGRIIARYWSFDEPANAQVWTPVTKAITLQPGLNTLMFSHANFDCGVDDTIRNLQVSSDGNIIFSDSRERPLNCTTSVIYSFNNGPPVPPSPLIITFTSAEKLTATFKASASGGVSPYAYSWDFGDSTTGTGAIVTHVYSAPGTYNIVLTVKDITNQTLTTAQTITI